MSLSRGVRALAEAGIRERCPDATDEEVRVRLTVRLYGRAAAEKLFGAVPDDAR
jgi:DNA-binding MarR family transcriptional regulator